MSQQLSIGSAVGRQPALNSPRDQQVIITLLASIDPENGGPTSDLPPATGGPNADFRLVNAIFNFQREMVRRGRMRAAFADARVDPGGTTLRLMNAFAASRRGGGLEIPIDPPNPKPAPAPRKSSGFLGPLFGQMRPRPTNLKLNPGASVSGGFGPIGGSIAAMTVADSRPPKRPDASLKMVAAGLSLGPLPFGIEIAPSSFPSLGSQIHSGPRSTTNELDVEDIVGLCLIVGVSANAGSPVGGNASTILFNIGSNRSLQTLAQDLLTLSGPNPAINFVLDAFNTCRAFASTLGLFGGLSVGVSMIEGVLINRSPNIRPDPSAQAGRDREPLVIDAG